MEENQRNSPSLRHKKTFSTTVFSRKLFPLQNRIKHVFLPRVSVLLPEMSSPKYLGDYFFFFCEWEFGPCHNSQRVARYRSFAQIQTDK